jgi:glycosyltransferase involved in cell wall biosynthesis
MHVGIHGYELAGLACRRCGIPCLGMHMTTPVDEGYWARRWLMRYTDRRYGHVCSQSRFCTGEWKRRHGLRPDRTSFIWSSVDTDRFRPAAPRRMRGAADEFRLVSVGRLHAMKGFEFLIEAVAMLNDGRVTAEILGEGDERGNLEQRIRDRRLAGTVRLRGYVEDPRPHLAEADCFVLPSVSLESCPAVLPEAMAMGLPLITSDFGPLTEVNVDGQTGWVVPVRDSVALAGSIREAMERPDRCRSLGEAGQRRAGTSFSRDRMLRETLALYGRLARRTSGSPT